MKTILNIYYDQSLKRLKEKVTRIREKSVQNLFNYLEKSIKSLEKNGICVYIAKDYKEAQKILLDLVDDNVVLKSKTNAGNEIKLKEVLRKNDVEVIETDLGDFLADLIGFRSEHPVVPVEGLDINTIKDAVEKKFEIKLEKPEDIAKTVRNYIKEKLMKCKIGITGCNAFSTEGKLFLVENEGNISYVSRLEKHIVVTSIEKVNETDEECLTICKAQALFGLYSYPSYINVISGPSKTGDLPGKLIKGMYGAKEVHMIIIDNERSEIYNSEFKEILKCINCGLCFTSCPIFNVNLRFKGRKSILEIFRGENILDPFMCTGCKICSILCPAGINIQKLIRLCRTKLVDRDIQVEGTREMIENIVKYGNPVGEKISEIKPLCC